MKFYIFTIALISLNIGAIFAQNVSFEYNQAGEMVKIERPFTITAVNDNNEFNQRENNSSNVVIYPNPVKDYISIELHDSNKGNYDIKITDVDGKPLQSFRQVNGKQDINLKHYTSGLHFITITTNSNCETYKIIKY